MERHAGPVKQASSRTFWVQARAPFARLANTATLKVGSFAFIVCLPTEIAALTTSGCTADCNAHATSAAGSTSTAACLCIDVCVCLVVALLNFSHRVTLV